MPKIAGTPGCPAMSAAPESPASLHLPSISFIIACTLKSSYVSVHVHLSVNEPPGGAEGMRLFDGSELISGAKKSSSPSPVGPETSSYAKCLSDHAVCRPAALTTLKIVLVRMNWCGKSVG